MKKKFNTFKNILFKYTSTNVLFLSFVIISLIMSFILRIVTMGNPIYVRAIFGDLLMLVLIGSFGYLFKPSKQFTYFFSWLIFFIILCIMSFINHFYLLI